MKLFSLRLALPIAAVLLVGCGDDGGETADVDSGPDPVTVNDFVGSWQASSYVYTNNADELEQYDLIANGGENRMTVLTGGGVRTWLTTADLDDEWDAQLTVDGTTLTATPVEATRPTYVWEFTLTGDELTLSGADGEFDFTQTDATPVSATVSVAMTRN